MKKLRKKIEDHEGIGGYEGQSIVEKCHNDNITRMYAATWILENYYQASYNWLQDGDSRCQYLAKKLSRGLAELLKGFKQVNIRMSRQRMANGRLAVDAFEDDMLFNTAMLDRALGLSEDKREELLAYIDNTYFKEIQDGNN